MALSMDLTAAWYAAAPPPPPVPVETSFTTGSPVEQHQRRPFTSSRDSAMGASSSSLSIGFDASAKGDDLPADSFAPEPERPVSRNAMAKVREKERLRARTNSTSTHASSDSANQAMSRQHTSDVPQYDYQTVMAQSTIRARHDSSPAGAAPWATHTSQGSPYGQPGISIIDPQAQYQSDTGFTQPSYWQPHQVVTPHNMHHASLPPSPIKSSWSPVASSPAATSFMHPSFYSAPPSAQTPYITSWSAASSPVTSGYSSPVPFPTSQAMPPPAMSASQLVYGHPASHEYQYQHQHQPQQHRQHQHRQHSSISSRPLPSPSRSSSQSSSIGTGSSSPSTMSISSGTVRRSLPQPPVAPLEKVASIDQQKTLGRHDSVRMAAEEIMARGPPRRKHISTGSRSGTAFPIITKMTQSDTDDGKKSLAHQQQRSPTRITRAESADCLVKEMEKMQMNDNSSRSSRNDSTSSAVQAPTREIMRAASPRPIRAAPEPAPAISIDIPVEEVIPARPLSRGPKDERERRKSSAGIDTAIARQIPPIFSPPPDTKPAIPTFSFDDGNTMTAPGAPSIVLPGEGVSLPSIQVDRDCPPSIAIEAPSINISSDDSEEDLVPKPSISISVSSSSVAQRSTTTTNSTSSSSSANNHSRQQCSSSRKHDLHRQVAPASASSIGSGASCATCQKWIGGRVVHAMNLTFHPDCFNCCHCSEHLEHVAFYEHEGRPYCHFDYHELFSKRCFHCRTPIVDQRYITINDVDLVGGNAGERCYHDLHFFCANCGDPFMDPKLASSAAGSCAMDVVEDEEGKVRFGGREFVVYKGYPYCETCHVSLHKPKCKGCKKSIVEQEYLTALKGKWHLNCFCCQICQEPIQNDNFFVQNGQAYDEECYKIKLRSEL